MYSFNTVEESHSRRVLDALVKPHATRAGVLEAEALHSAGFACRVKGWIPAFAGMTHWQSRTRQARAG